MLSRTTSKESIGARLHEYRRVINTIIILSILAPLLIRTEPLKAQSLIPPATAPEISASHTGGQTGYYTGAGFMIECPGSDEHSSGQIVAVTDNAGVNTDVAVTAQHAVKGCRADFSKLTVKFVGSDGNVCLNTTAGDVFQDILLDPTLSPDGENYRKDMAVFTFAEGAMQNLLSRCPGKIFSLRAENVNPNGYTSSAEHTSTGYGLVYNTNGALIYGFGIENYINILGSDMHEAKYATTLPGAPETASSIAAEGLENTILGYDETTDPNKVPNGVSYGDSGGSLTIVGSDNKIEIIAVIRKVYSYTLNANGNFLKKVTLSYYDPTVSGLKTAILDCLKGVNGFIKQPVNKPGLLKRIFLPLIGG